MILVAPRVDEVPTTDFTLDATRFPSSQLTELHDSDAENDYIGAVPASNADTNTPFLRAAYDYIESGANIHLFVLPYQIAASQDNAAHITAATTALDAAMGSADERAKLPGGEADIIVVPRLCGVGTVANALVTALETVCAPNHQGLVAWVDAGDHGAAVGARPSAAAPSIANVQTWAGNNKNIAIYAVSNRAHVPHYNDMWGSVIAAAHHARYAAQHGVWAHPFNLVDPILGAGTRTPDRAFDPGDGSSASVALEREHQVGSVIGFDGADFLWGGKSYNPVRDPRQYVGNHVVANRMVKEARRYMVRFLKRHATGSRLESLRLAVERPLVNRYVPHAVRDVQARQPTLTHDQATVLLEVNYYGFIESVQLLVEVYQGEVE